MYLYMPLTLKLCIHNLFCTNLEEYSKKSLRSYWIISRNSHNIHTPPAQGRKNKRATRRRGKNTSDNKHKSQQNPQGKQTEKEHRASRTRGNKEEHKESKTKENNRTPNTQKKRGKQRRKGKSKRGCFFFLLVPSSLLLPQNYKNGGE